MSEEKIVKITPTNSLHRLLGSLIGADLLTLRWEDEKSFEDLEVLGNLVIDLEDSELTMPEVLLVNSEISILTKDIAQKILSSESVQLVPVVFGSKFSIFSNFGDVVTSMFLSSREKASLKEFYYDFIEGAPVLTVLAFNLGSQWKEFIIDDEEVILYTKLSKTRTVFVEGDEIRICLPELPTLAISSQDYSTAVSLKNLPSKTLYGNLLKIEHNEDTNLVSLAFSRLKEGSSYKRKVLLPLSALLDFDEFTNEIWEHIFKDLESWVRLKETAKPRILEVPKEDHDLEELGKSVSSSQENLENKPIEVPTIEKRPLGAVSPSQERLENLEKRLRNLSENEENQ